MGRLTSIIKQAANKKGIAALPESKKDSTIEIDVVKRARHLRNVEAVKRVTKGDRGVRRFVSHWYFQVEK